MSGVTRYNVRCHHTTREVGFRESRELANSKIAPALCYEGGIPGYYVRQSILKISSPFLTGLSIYCCGITIFRASVPDRRSLTNLLPLRFS
ncbi:hypothetical protein AVEN_70677-1 [Araneus ventricosus]|uniref:Uncharacterized protein n=1 Tax=Araneus ventricosus TaxID=182803 RepID=A0A4Y2WY46_ARAVE|nr:hypothetical protein AVEN_70677-1 [Araneus ventricosus]